MGEKSSLSLRLGREISMDSQTPARFLKHIFKFFSVRSNEEEPTTRATDAGGPADGEGGQPGSVTTTTPTASASAAADPGPPDVPELLGLLRAVGFFVQYTDKSDFWGSSGGCRVIVTCKRSGNRVVLDSDGPCSCPSEEAMKSLVHVTRPGQAASRAPSPTPSTSAMLEDSTLNSTGKPDAQLEAVPTLVRQRTFSREDGAQPSAPLPENRRLSAPPGPMQSAWATFQGDELNVLAATDLLQEAMSLLSGVKKVNLRNTPVGPMRRLSAMGAVPNRRASSDAFAMPLRPLSRTSSTSSGLASIMSSASTQSSQADTPRPSRPGRTTATGPGGPGQTVSLRRTMSAVNSSAKTPLGTTVRAKQLAAKKGVAEESKSSSKFFPRMPSLLKAPSQGIGNKASTRSPRKAGSDSNSSLPASKIPQTCKTVHNPDGETVRL